MKQAFQKIVKLLTWYSRKSITNRKLEKLQQEIIEYRNTAGLYAGSCWTCIKVRTLSSRKISYRMAGLFSDLHWQVIKKHASTAKIQTLGCTICCDSEDREKIRFNALTETAALLDEVKEDINSGIALDHSLKTLICLYKLQNYNSSDNA